MTDIILETSDLTAGYPRSAGRDAVSVVKSVSETLYAGELVCLVGPNGAGKSTLLRTLAGMQAPVSGSISVLGQDIRTMEPDARAKLLSLVLTHKIDAGFLTGYALAALGRSP